MIRTVFTADKNTLTLPLPDYYIGRKVEVIAFMIDEEKEIVQNQKRLLVLMP